MTKFNVGDKVVPISKTVDWNTLNRTTNHLDKSSAWNEALENEQKYLYVNNIDKFRNIFTCSNEPDGSGDYFHESDLTPYKTKPTKNQRITALENEVAELKLIVHELRDGRKTMRVVMNEVLSKPSTTTVKDIIEFEGKQYRKVDRLVQVGDVVVFTQKHAEETNEKEITAGKPYEVIEAFGEPRFLTNLGCRYRVYEKGFGRTSENVAVYELIEGGLNPQISMVDETIEPLTPNQQRAAIIEKAKVFIEDTKDVTGKLTGRKGYKHSLIGYADADFKVNVEKRTIVVLLKRQTKNQILGKGIAKCNPSDVFNEHIGKAIALGRALGLDVSEFEQVVQPSHYAVGQIGINSLGTSYPFEVIKIGKGEVFKKHFEPYTYSTGNTTRPLNFEDGNYKALKIINDTNAKYEEG